MSYYKQYKKTNVTAEDIRLFYLMSNRNTFKKVVHGGLWMSLLVEQSFLLLVRYTHCIECLKKNKTFDTHDLPMKGKNQTVIRKKKRKTRVSPVNPRQKRQTIPSLIMNLVTWKVTLSWVENIKARSSH